MSVYEKNGKWYYQFMLFGIRKHGACKGVFDKTGALEYEAEIKNELSLIHRGKKDKSEIITVSEMFANFLDYSKLHNAPDTYNMNKHLIDDIFTPYLGKDTHIIKINNVILDKLKSHLKTEYKLKNSSINRYFRVIERAFNLIILSEKLYMVNPCKYVQKLKEDNAITRYLTEKEELGLMKCLPEYLKPIVICALTTGLRLSNILNLKWESIDFKYGFIEILKQENKGHKKIQIPLSNKFKQELKKIGIKEKGFVFINPKTNKPYNNIRKGFTEALKEAGIKNFRFHDLRHTVGTRLVAKGADLQTVKEYLAHSDLKTTQRYLHPVNDNMKKAVNILDSF